MKRVLWLVCMGLAGIGTVSAAVPSSEAKRLQEAAQVLTELRQTPDKGIPEEIWNKAECVMVIPSMK